MATSAHAMNEKGRVHEDEGRHEQAEACYRTAIECDSEWSIPWFNLGLLYKRQGRWEESLRHNQRALELNPEDEGALWNVGIAATALEDWKTARAAWKKYGINIAEGSGPINEAFGPTPIRVSMDAHPEVVWSQRIDPARAIIENIPLPESGRRWRDVLLHDGAPNGHRMLNGKEVPVFDELQLLKPSYYSTFLAEIEAPDQTSLDDLEKSIEKLAEVEMEDWTSNIRLLCAACSEGRPHEHDHHQADESGWRPNRMVGLAAAEPGAAHSILKDWEEASRGRRIQSFKCVLDARP